jgi:predicted MPP superfamily phosphohydrolase
MIPSQFITERLFEVDFGYLKKDKLNVVVSSGIGTWGPPIRIGNNSELVEINLKFTE